MNLMMRIAYDFLIVWMVLTSAWHALHDDWLPAIYAMLLVVVLTLNEERLK